MEFVVISIDWSFAANIFIEVLILEDSVSVDAGTEDTKKPGDRGKTTVYGVTRAVFVISASELSHAEEVVNGFLPRVVVVMSGFDQWHDGTHVMVLEQSHHEGQKVG